MVGTVLVTGASSGLGRATALLFQRRGWNVVATMRDLSGAGGLDRMDRVLVERLDVTDVQSIRSAVDAALARFGAVDAVVNNAGFGAFGPLETTPIEVIRRQLDVNVIGVLQVTQALLPHFRARRSGVVVNISSTGGRAAFPLGALYHCSKFAVEGATEALQYELSPFGVRVRLVEPAGIRTDFPGRSAVVSDAAGIAEYQPLIEAAMARYEEALGPRAEPEEIAEFVFRAATDGNADLRCVAGDEAERMLALRAARSDRDFSAEMRKRFGLAA